MNEKEKERNSHIDYSRSHENVYLVQKDLKQLYRDEFDEALETYNAKQKRADRKIDDYYKHIQSSKKTSLQQEMIIQVGDKDDFSSNYENIKLANEVLKEWFDGFRERNPNLHVYNAVIHNDEASPHMHLNFVPIATGYKRGLEKQVSFDRAITQQDSTLNKERPFDDWREKEVELLERMLKERGIERKLVGTNKHKDVNEYKEKQQELEALKNIDKEINKQLSHIKNIKTSMAAIKEIDKSKVVKGGLIRSERIELPKKNYEMLIQAGRENIKLRKRNYELSSKAKAVDDKEREVNLRLEKVIEREKELQKARKGITEHRKILSIREEHVKEQYTRQRNLNALLERTEAENKELKDENRSLRLSEGRLRRLIDDLRGKVGNLEKRLRGAFEDVRDVVQAMGMFKYSKEGYKANLTERQGDLVDAVSEFAEKRAKDAGFEDLAEEMETTIGVSKDIKVLLPEERIKPGFSMDDVRRRDEEIRSNSRSAFQRSNSFDMER